MKRNSFLWMALGIVSLIVPKDSLAALAFPGAEGFGASTRGAYELYEKTQQSGDLPTIIHVTNLQDSGIGSFRYAVESAGPRVVVFDLGGIITLSDEIIVDDSYLTVAGQTAPGDGITLRGAAFRTRGSHDIIVRGMRFRPTAIASIGDSNSANRDGFAAEGSYSTPNNPPGRDIIFDHNSVSWSTDEMFNAWNGVVDITLSHNLFYKPSNKNNHHYGVIFGPGTLRASYHHNVLMHSIYRNPLVGGTNSRATLDAATDVEIINNIVYNGRYYSGVQVTADSKGGSKLQNVVTIGEYHKNGVDTEASSGNARDYRFGALVQDDSNILYSGVLSIRRQDHEVDDEWLICSTTTCNSKARVDDWPFTPSGARATESSENYSNLMGMDGNVPRVGAYPRDIVDTIALEELNTGTDFLGTGGTWGPGPSDPATTTDWRNNRSKFPAYASGTPPTDTDRDGMPNTWEISKGLNPNEASDAHADPDGDGYKNIEEYINSFFVFSDSLGLGMPRDFRIR